MAATVRVMQSSMAVVSAATSWTTSPANALKGGIVRLPLAPRRVPCFRCQASENGPSAMRKKVDSATKTEITKEDVLRHQESDQSEKQLVFGSVPSNGSFYPRPKLERNPETGDKSLGSIFAFDGAALETINGRLAMVGFVWATLAERATRLAVREQVFTPGATGLPFFIATTTMAKTHIGSTINVDNSQSIGASEFLEQRAKAAVDVEESPVGEWSVNRLHMAGHGTVSVVSFLFELGPKGGLGPAGDVVSKQLVLTKSSLVEQRPDNYKTFIVLFYP